MAQCKGPKVTMVMLGPTKGGVNHHGPTGPDGMLDGIFCNTVVMMPSYSTVTDALALLGKF